MGQLDDFTAGGWLFDGDALARRLRSAALASTFPVEWVTSEPGGTTTTDFTCGRINESRTLVAHGNSDDEKLDVSA